MFSPKTFAGVHLTTSWTRVSFFAMLVTAGLSAGSALAASGRGRHTPQASAPAAAVSPQVGLASWNEVTGSPRGGRTASERRWVNSELVAAHRTLPLGSKVRVVNLSNGLAVEVVIIDRGPYAAGRVIDLSVAAAIRLGMISDGIAKVRLEVADGNPIRAGVSAMPRNLLASMMMALLQGWGAPLLEV